MTETFMSQMMFVYDILIVSGTAFCVCKILR